VFYSHSSPLYKKKMWYNVLLSLDNLPLESHWITERNVQETKV